MSEKKWIKKAFSIDAGKIFISIILVILFLSNMAAAEILHVSSSRYSLFAPWTNKASDTSLSANFTAYALLLDNNGRPVSGQSITFRIYSSAILKATKTNITQANGLASVPYDTFPDFTAQSDPDYGTWRIEANLTSNFSVNDRTNMEIEEGGSALGCSKNYCHSTNTVTGAKPLSPYTADYGSTLTRAAAAHKKSNHQNAGCPVCHPGYASDKTATGIDGKVYGKTADVHSNRTCEYCHGNWAYITGTGDGIPLMPSCYQCHPVLNSNVMSISTLANLAAGNGISVYSYNYDLKKPLAAHNSTVYSLVDSVPCIVCHGPAHNNSKPYNAVSSSNDVTENEQCWTCHTARATTHKSNTNCVSCHSQDAHKIIIGGGGPDCISCHNSTGSATHKVDTSAMNSGEHANLNSGATAVGVSAENKKCWGCHQTGGTQPSDMGDRYANPYKCYDCHNATKPYINVNGALTVSEHFKNGTDIQSAISATDNSASCLVCHNVSEMKVSYTDNEFTEYSLASHYGKARSDLRDGSSTGCEYCHQNSSTAFSRAMTNATNKVIDNHSINNPLTNPGCTNSTCHDTGLIHNSTLTKPVLALPNSSYCRTCHGPLGSASLKNKEQHNGTVNCTECHLNSSLSIHPVRYLQQDTTTWSTSKASAVNCTNCHQGTGFLNAPIIPDPLKHSNNLINGTIWGTFWTSEQNSCVYCHEDTKHNVTALGRPSQFEGNNIVGSTISNTTYWCSSCHWQGYTSGANNYNDMVNIFISLAVPPEITGHSTYGANQSKPGYFNHSTVAKDDASCQSCHGGLTSGTNITGFLHNVTNVTEEGSSSSPYDITLNQSIGMYDTRIDKYNESLCRYCHNSTYFGGVRTRHHNLVGDQINPTNGQPFSCQDCHPNITVNGNQQPLYDRNCINCHNGTAFWGNTLGAQVNITRPHHINTSYDDAGIGEPAQTRQCNVCHGSFVANYNDSHYIPSYNTSFMITPYADFKAYNATSGKYWGGCYACHQNSSSVTPVIMTPHDTHHGAISGWGREGGIEHQEDATPGRLCTWCHLSLDVHNTTVNITVNGVEETVLELRNSTLMAADIANATFEPGTTVPINGTACEKCHSVQSIHNIQAVNNGQAGFGHIGNNSDCNGCHASWIAGAAPLQGAIIPSVDIITPSVVLAGSANSITITGMNFVNDAYTSVVSVDGVTYTPASITDKQMIVNIPALNAGVHALQLVKGDAKSKLAALTVVTQTTVASAKLASGKITVTGTNFGPKPDPAFSDLGVFITRTVKGKAATFRATVISWSDTSIVVDAGTAVLNDKLKVKDLNGQASTTVKGK